MEKFFNKDLIENQTSTTIVCSELTDQRVLNKIYNSKIALLDIDYTICDFNEGNTAGLKSVKDIVGKDMANEFNNIFNLVLMAGRNLNLLSNDEREKYKEFENAIKKFENKVWSREVYLILASEKLRIKINKETVEKVADAYWENLSKNIQYYPDAIKFLDQIKENGVKIIWMTGSDSRLRLEEKNDQINATYDAEYSIKKKSKRLTKLLNDYPGEIVIGDPWDKPSEIFFNKVFEYTGNINHENIMAVGDSERNDLMVPKARGCNTVLIKRR